jgi:hypothetical protein
MAKPMDIAENIAAKWLLIALGVGIAISVVGLLIYHFLFGSTAWASAPGFWLAVMIWALFRATKEAYLAGRAEAQKGAGTGPAPQ